MIDSRYETFVELEKILKRIERHLDVISGGSSGFMECALKTCQLHVSHCMNSSCNINKHYFLPIKYITLIHLVKDGWRKLKIVECDLDSDLTAQFAHGIAKKLSGNLSDRIYKYVLLDPVFSGAQETVCYFRYKEGQDKIQRNEKRSLMLLISENSKVKNIEVRTRGALRL